MNVLDAAYHTVHDYAGGSASLAPRLGKNPGTLSHEVKPPKDSTAKLGLIDAIKIMAMTGDHRMLHATAAELGHLCVPMPTAEQVGETSAEHLSRIAREFADVLGEVSTAMGDGRVSDNELRRIERQWSELVAAGQLMLRHFTAMNHAARPEEGLKLRAIGEGAR